MLFEVQEEVATNEKRHLLELVFESRLRRRFHGWENLAHRLVSDFQYNTRTLTHLPEYKELWKRLRDMPDFRRIAAASYPEGKPAPSFVFHVQHSTLGRLALRTATTVFTGVNTYSMVSYVPGDSADTGDFIRTACSRGCWKKGDREGRPYNTRMNNSRYLQIMVSKRRIERMDVPTSPTASTAPSTPIAPAHGTYHARRGLIVMGSLVLFLACFGFVPLLAETLPGLASAQSPSTLVGEIISIVLLTLIVAAFVAGYIALLRMRIVTSDESIAFYCPPYRLSTSWRNVASIGERVNRRGGRYKVLELRQRAETFVPNRWLGFITNWLNQPGTHIPIDYFVTLGKEDQSRLMAEIQVNMQQQAAAAPNKKKKGKGKK